MKGYGVVVPFKEFGPVEAEIPQIGPLDALAEPVALAACSSDPHRGTCRASGRTDSGP